MNNWNNQYGYNNWDRPSTNIQYVTSLEEALSRSYTRGSENVYFHQDQQVFYRVRVDTDGRKYWQEFTYITPKPSEDTIPVVKSDLTDIVERLQRIENYVFQPVEVSNEQSNG